jgi:carboxymethylenebutenolidase
LEDGFVEYLTKSERAEAYCLNPKVGPPLGQVIVIHEVWGFTKYIKDVCGRLSRQGFRAVAPILYWRDKDLFSPGNVREGTRLVWELSLKERYRPAMLEAAIKKGRPSGETAAMLRVLYNKRFRTMLDSDMFSLASNLHEEYPGQRIGAIGFSMGGKLAMRLATGFPQLAACVAYSAEPVRGATEGKIRSPMMLLYGSEDKFMMGGLPAFVNDAINEGRGLALKTYANAGHEFFDHTGKRRYQEAAAEDAWAISIDFLRRNLSVAARERARG